MALWNCNDQYVDYCGITLLKHLVFDDHIVDDKQYYASITFFQLAAQNSFYSTVIFYEANH